jgi:hypothetical protein
VEEFQALVIITRDKKLYLIKENDTRWFSIYLLLLRAIKLRILINMFVFNHRVSVKDKKNLLDLIMSSED